jgi:signal peptidase
MSPAIDAGDLAFIRRVDPVSLAAGDIITFKTATGLVTHRITGVAGPNGRPLLRVKGDANGSEDPRPVGAQDVAGEVVAVLPGAGRTLSLVTSSAFRIVLIGVPAIVLGAIMFGEQRRKRSAVQARASGASADAGREG